MKKKLLIILSFFTIVSFLQASAYTNPCIEELITLKMISQKDTISKLDFDYLLLETSAYLKESKTQIDFKGDEKLALLQDCININPDKRFEEFGLFFIDSLKSAILLGRIGKDVLPKLYYLYNSNINKHFAILRTLFYILKYADNDSTLFSTKMQKILLEKFIDKDKDVRFMAVKVAGQLNKFDQKIYTALLWVYKYDDYQNHYQSNRALRFPIRRMAWKTIRKMDKLKK